MLYRGLQYFLKTSLGKLKSNKQMAY